jgi:hypothetical protein
MVNQGRLGHAPRLATDLPCIHTFIVPVCRCINAGDCNGSNANGEPALRNDRHHSHRISVDVRDVADATYRLSHCSVSSGRHY